MKKGGRLPGIRETLDIIKRIEDQAQKKQFSVSELLRLWIRERLILEEKRDKIDR